MKLLFDENLSARLAILLQDIFPNSVHVDDCNLSGVEDNTIWNFAKENELTIVTKDSSSKKYQQDDDDELDFIPNVNINKMTSKGTPKTTIISTSSNDINETMEALKKVTKKE